MTDSEIDLEVIEPYFPGQGQRILECFQSVPALGVGAGFMGDLLKLFDDFRNDDGHEANSTEFRLKIGRLICRLVLAVTQADCVFIRRLRTDGSVELFGNPRWSSGKEAGKPVHEKGKGTGVSGRVLNGSDSDPVFIRDIDAHDNPFRRDHFESVEMFPEGSDEHTFLSNIKSEFCVPLTVKKRIIAGIVGVRWEVYDSWEADKKKQILKTWQDIFADLYYSGMRLEQREHLQRRIEAFTSAVSSQMTPLTDDEFLREMVTILTCDAGLRWHRAFIFLFDQGYPSDARCVMAIGGTGIPNWHVRHRLFELQALNLEGYLRRAKSADFAEDDDLFHLATMQPSRLVIPAKVFANHPTLHPLFVGDSMSRDSLAGGLAVLEPDDTWLSRQRWNYLAFVGSARSCRRYISPLLRPAPDSTRVRPTRQPIPSPGRDDK